MRRMDIPCENKTSRLDVYSNGQKQKKEIESGGGVEGQRLGKRKFQKQNSWHLTEMNILANREL